MSQKFLKKYRVRSARAGWWDYGQDGSYFVTICTSERDHFFGEIVNGKMRLSPAGEMAKVIWNDIPKQFPYVRLGEFVVMPNHVHGVIYIDKGGMKVAPSTPNDRQSRMNNSNDRGGATGISNPMLHDNLSRVVRWFKGRTTYECHKFLPEFGWQTRFHDHIVRSDKEQKRIDIYIRNNPQNWSRDEYSKPR